MSELEPPKLQDGSTAEKTEVWTIALTAFYRYTTTVSGPMTEAGTVASYPQTIQTGNAPNPSQGIVIFTPPSVGQWSDFSNGFNTSSPYWVELTGDESPLTEDELRDIHQGITEIESGKAKHFKSMRETIDWLHRKRE